METEEDLDVESFETALAGWLAIVGVVVAYDAWAILTERQTLSSAFWRTQESRYGVAVAALWGGLSWHLIMGNRQVLPDRFHDLYLRVHPLHRGRIALVRRNNNDDMV